MCDQTEVEYLPDQVVWVKLSNFWWPAQVQDVTKLPEDVTQGLRKTPIAVVKFLNEDTYEYIKNIDQIYHYNCLRKFEFIKKGLDAARSASTQSHMNKFPEDVIFAEELTDGDKNILNDSRLAPEKKYDYKELFTASKKPKQTPGKPHTSSPAVSSRAVSHVKQTRMTNGCSFDLSNFNPPANIKFVCENCDFMCVRLSTFMCHKQFYRNHCPIGTNESFLKQLKSDKTPFKKKANFEDESSKLKRKVKSTFDSPLESDLDSGKKLPKKRRIQSKKSREAIKKKEFEAVREQLLQDWEDEESEGEAMDQSDSTGVLEESPVKNSEEKDQSADGSGANMSCFDFEENDEAINLDENLKFGQKLPRVIANEKPRVRDDENLDPASSLSKSSVDDSFQVDINNLLAETEMPSLPPVPKSFLSVSSAFPAAAGKAEETKSGRQEDEVQSEKPPSEEGKKSPKKSISSQLAENNNSISFVTGSPVKEVPNKVDKEFDSDKNVSASVVESSSGSKESNLEIPNEDPSAAEQHLSPRSRKSERRSSKRGSTIKPEDEVTSQERNESEINSEVSSDVKSLKGSSRKGINEIDSTKEESDKSGIPENTITSSESNRSPKSEKRSSNLADKRKGSDNKIKETIDHKHSPDKRTAKEVSSSEEKTPHRKEKVESKDSITGKRKSEASSNYNQKAHSESDSEKKKSDKKEHYKESSVKRSDSKRSEREKGSSESKTKSVSQTSKSAASEEMPCVDSEVKHVKDIKKSPSEVDSKSQKETNNSKGKDHLSSSSKKSKSRTSETKVSKSSSYSSDHKEKDSKTEKIKSASKDNEKSSHKHRSSDSSCDDKKHSSRHSSRRRESSKDSSKKDSKDSPRKSKSDDGLMKSDSPKTTVKQKSSLENEIPVVPSPSKHQKHLHKDEPKTDKLIREETCKSSSSESNCQYPDKLNDNEKPKESCMESCTEINSQPAEKLNDFNSPSCAGDIVDSVEKEIIISESNMNFSDGAGIDLNDQKSNDTTEGMNRHFEPNKENESTGAFSDSPLKNVHNNDLNETPNDADNLQNKLNNDVQNKPESYIQEKSERQVQELESCVLNKLECNAEDNLQHQSESEVPKKLPPPTMYTSGFLSFDFDDTPESTVETKKVLPEAKDSPVVNDAPAFETEASETMESAMTVEISESGEQISQTMCDGRTFLNSTDVSSSNCNATSLTQVISDSLDQQNDQGQEKSETEINDKEVSSVQETVSQNCGNEKDKTNAIQPIVVPPPSTFDSKQVTNVLGEVNQDATEVNETKSFPVATSSESQVCSSSLSNIVLPDSSNVAGAEHVVLTSTSFQIVGQSDSCDSLQQRNLTASEVQNMELDINSMPFVIDDSPELQIPLPPPPAVPTNADAPIKKLKIELVKAGEAKKKILTGEAVGKKIIQIPAKAKPPSEPSAKPPGNVQPKQQMKSLKKISIPSILRKSGSVDTGGSAQVKPIKSAKSPSTQVFFMSTSQAKRGGSIMLSKSDPKAIAPRILTGRKPVLVSKQFMPEHVVVDQSSLAIKEGTSTPSWLVAPSTSTEVSPTKRRKLSETGQQIEKQDSNPNVIPPGSAIKLISHKGQQIIVTSGKGNASQLKVVSKLMLANSKVIPDSSAQRRILPISKDQTTGLQVRQQVISGPNLLQTSQKRKAIPRGKQFLNIPSSVLTQGKKTAATLVQDAASAKDSMNMSTLVINVNDANLVQGNVKNIISLPTNSEKNLYLGSSGDMNNMILKNDPIQQITPVSGQDILAKALANTQVLLPDSSDNSNLESNAFVEQPLYAPTTLSHNALETSLTLNQPIMAPAEVSTAGASNFQITSIPSTYLTLDGTTPKLPNVQPSMPLLSDDLEVPQSILIDSNNLQNDGSQVAYLTFDGSNVVVTSSSALYTPTCEKVSPSAASAYMENKGMDMANMNPNSLIPNPPAVAQTVDQMISDTQLKDNIETSVSDYLTFPSGKGVSSGFLNENEIVQTESNNSLIPQVVDLAEISLPPDEPKKVKEIALPPENVALIPLPPEPYKGSSTLSFTVNRTKESAFKAHRDSVNKPFQSPLLRDSQS